MVYNINNNTNKKTKGSLTRRKEIKKTVIILFSSSFILKNINIICILNTMYFYIIFN